MTLSMNDQQDDFEPEQPQKQDQSQQDDFTPEQDDFTPEKPKKKTSKDLSWWDLNFTREGMKIKEDESRNFVEAVKSQASKNVNFAKSVVSGATAGFSEMVPGLETEEGAEQVVGKLGGSLAPIGLASKAIAYPLKAAAHLAPKFAKPIHALGNLLGLSVAGGVYEGLEESAKESIEQQEFVPPSPETIAKEGAKWAALDAALSTLGATGRFAKALYKKSTALEKPVVDILTQTLKKSGSGDKVAEKAISILEEKPIQQVEKELKLAEKEFVPTKVETVALENLPEKIEQKTLDIKTKKVDQKDFTKLESSAAIQAKPYLPAEFEAEKIAEKALTEDLTIRLEEVSHRAATERELGENIKHDLERQIEAAKKETDALYNIAKQVETIESPELNKTAGKIIEELKKIKEGNLKLSPEGYLKAEKQLTQVVEDLGYSLVQDSKGAIDKIIKVKPVPLSQAIEVKKRLNKIINYDLIETSAQDFLKGPAAALREDIRVGYGSKDSPARKAFEKAERQFGETAEKKGKKSITSMRYSERPESIAKVIKTPSGLADVKDIVSKEQFAQIERELLEHMQGLGEDRAAAYYREVRPSLTPNTRSVAEEIIASKAPAASPTRKASQRAKIKDMIFDDISQATITGKRPEKVLDLWKTKEGQQLIKNALENNPNKKEVLKYLEQQSFADFYSSVISSDGKINFKKFNEYLKDPATAENIRLIAGEEGLNFFKNLETLTNRVKKNKSVLEGRIDKAGASERERISKEIDKKGRERLAKIKQKNEKPSKTEDVFQEKFGKEAKKDRKESQESLIAKGKERFRRAKEKREFLTKEEKIAKEISEKSSLIYKFDDFLNSYGMKAKGALTALGILQFGSIETIAAAASYEIFMRMAKNPRIREAIKKAAVPRKDPLLIIRSLSDIDKAFEDD